MTQTITRTFERILFFNDWSCREGSHREQRSVHPGWLELFHKLLQGSPWVLITAFGGVFKYVLFIFHPENWGKWIQFDDNIFQMGWFNHQLLLRSPSRRSFERPWGSRCNTKLASWSFPSSRRVVGDPPMPHPRKSINSPRSLRPYFLGGGCIGWVPSNFHDYLNARFRLTFNSDLPPTQYH